MDLTYEILRLLLGPDNITEQILALIASALLWRFLGLLLGPKTQVKPGPDLQEKEAKRKISSVHQTRIDYPEKHNSWQDEEDNAGCRDELINQIIIPLCVVIIAIGVLFGGLLQGCR